MGARPLSETFSTKVGNSTQSSHQPPHLPQRTRQPNRVDLVNLLRWVVVVELLVNLQILEVVVALANHPTLGRSPTHLDSLEMCPRWEDLVLLQLLVKNQVPLDNQLPVGSVKRPTWEQSQIPLDSRQHKQVGLDNLQRSAKEVRSDNRLVVHNQAHSLRQHSLIKRNHLHLRKLASKEEALVRHRF